MKYKLNVSRDVDADEPGNYILNLPGGWQFTHDHHLHTYGYDSMRELRADIKTSVVPCDCESCKYQISIGR